MTKSLKLAVVATAAVLVAGCSSDDSPSTTSTPATTSSSANASTTTSPTATATGTETSSASAAPTSAAAGGDVLSMTGSQAANAAADAMLAAGSMRAAGTGNLVANQTGKFEMRLTSDSGLVKLTVQNASVEILTVDGKSYMKAPTKFWKTQGAPAAAVKKLDGKWAVMPGEAGSQAFTLKEFAKSVREPASPYDAKVASTTYKGTKVAVLSQKDGSKLFVALDGEPLPVHIERKGTDGGSIDFGGYGEPQSITAPSDPIDVTKLG